VDGVERAVIGVMPPDFSYPSSASPRSSGCHSAAASIKAPIVVSVYARLRPGAEWATAAAELDGLSRGQWTWRAIPDPGRHAEPGRHGLRAHPRPALLILLIACVNVACMLLARGMEREQELSVRRALGATRPAHRPPAPVENLVLAIAAGAIGAGLAVAMLRAARGALAALQPGNGGACDARYPLLPFALGASALACLLFGVVPALRLSRRDVGGSPERRAVDHRVEIAGYGGARRHRLRRDRGVGRAHRLDRDAVHALRRARAIHFTFPADRVVAMRVPGRGRGGRGRRGCGRAGRDRAAISSGMMGGSRVRAERRGLPAAVVSRLPVGAGSSRRSGCRSCADARSTRPSCAQPAESRS
jgi:hypothetical protein